MGKRSSKRRKNKLARPPKAKNKPIARPSALPPQVYEDDFDVDLSEVMHVSMFDSRRFQKFKETCDRVGENVPESLTEFATYDVPDLELRRWLTRYCIQKEKDAMPEWQRTLLEKIGFNWKRGRKPVAPKPARQRSSGAGKDRAQEHRQKQWEAQFESLRSALEGTDPMQGLVRTEPKLYGWFHRQKIADKKGKLLPQRAEQFESLLGDLWRQAPAPELGRWRRVFGRFLLLKARASDPSLNTDAALDASRNLERWSNRQRKKRERGELADWKIATLDAHGFSWLVTELEEDRSAQEKMEGRWYKKLDKLCRLEAEHGKPLPVAVVNQNGLRSWLERMRVHYTEGKLRPEVIQGFEERGFEFSRAGPRSSWRDSQWHRTLQRLIQFKERFGHVDVPQTYDEDRKLALWVSRQRERMRRNALEPDRTKILTDLGLTPFVKTGGPRKQGTQFVQWKNRYQKLKTELETRYDGKLSENVILSESWRAWLRRQRDHRDEGKLDDWQIEALAEINFDPKKLPVAPGIQIEALKWEDGMQRFKKFMRDHGHGKVPKSYDDHELALFVERTRSAFRSGNLTSEQVAELQNAGFIFDPLNTPTPAWMKCYAILKAYHAEHGDSAVPRVYRKDQPLAEYVAQQRQRGRKGKLLAEHIRLLDALDFQWSGGRPIPKEAAKKQDD